MIVSSIVAISKNHAIGRDNQIPWYLPADLKYFKKITTGHHVIMGRKTFESIGRPLPKRTNIVLTRDPFYTGSGILVAHSIEEALQLALDHGETEAFIIGGGKIYEETIEYWDKVYLTEVDIEIEDAEVFFPVLDQTHWKLVSKECHDADEKNEWSYCYLIYERIVNDFTNGRQDDDILDESEE